MKHLFIIVFSILALQLSGQKKQNLKSFSSLDVSSNIEITLIQSDVNKLEYSIVSGDESGLVIKESNGELSISTKNKGMFSGSNTKVKMTVYCKELKEIEVSAGATVRTKGEAKFDDLEVEVSSGGLVILDLRNKNCSVEVSSGGNATISGKGVKIKADASSGGSFNGENFETEHAITEVSSGGSIKVWCTKSLEADASSGGNVGYKGNPKKKDIDTGYSGSVSEL